ncbi:hypothetical protein [Actinotalea sp. K2]|uniref:hypothetical protein n=1 Tax=Actinotalea sp. K2 TaxID=2939438 RepID=UPI002017FEC2|nr:hypothetical protein [Actinotalea sp. K2]
MSTELAIFVVVGTPLLSFVAVMLGHWVVRRGDEERDVWRRREETLRTLRWAVETATSDHPVRAEAGLATLGELLDAEILQPADAPMVGTVAEVVLAATSAVARAPEPAHAPTREPAPVRPSAAAPSASPSPRQTRAATLAVRASTALGRTPDPALVELTRPAPTTGATDRG